MGSDLGGVMGRSYSHSHRSCGVGVCGEEVVSVVCVGECVALVL